MKKIAAVTIATGGLILAGAGSALASDAPSANARGTALNSPGIASGNVVQLPVHVPVNACGNSVSVIGLLNPAWGNNCVNH
ncbi:chaplin [Streptomyces armeniacus]|uniref:Chaplin n=1 Tax=Streptomyces armeniacus TaxID=83291 RepID=A0A345Y0L4_9ACTN|nr:chaplin [Streptomyces armeniacus]AXK37430.1 chaplin [Streptomyces armeniacus]